MPELDNFRDFIKYANIMFDEGKIDFILNTGDIVDYITEGFGADIAPDGRYSLFAGNFLFFEKLVLGQNPSADGVKKTTNERLRVPMFTILGNHDYRYHAFKLRFQILGFKEVEMFKSHGLKAAEADLLTRGLENYKSVLRAGGIIDTAEPTSADDALKMIAIDQKYLSYYKHKINRENSYVLKLGPHRFVMLDVKHDIGIPAGASIGYILKYIFYPSEAQESAVAGGPESKGLDKGQLELTKQAIDDAKSPTEKGLLVIGMHNGPINFKNGHFLNVIRSTIHPHIDPKWVKDALVKVGKVGAGEMLPAKKAEAKRKHLKLAEEAGWTFSGTPYFKTGSNEFYLDQGIASEMSNEFMKICAGTEFENGKNADLILYGHHHEHSEFLVKWKDGARKTLAYYTDYFTQNPARYYATIHPDETEDHLVRVMVKDGADPMKVEPISVRDTHSETGKEFNVWQLETPPYSNPLEKQSDKAEWWRMHSPLYLQTAALGPRDTYERKDPVNDDMSNFGLHFQGVRVITVNDNIISTIEAVPLAKIREEIAGL